MELMEISQQAQVVLVEVAQVAMEVQELTVVEIQQQVQMGQQVMVVQQEEQGRIQVVEASAVAVLHRQQLQVGKTELMAQDLILAIVRQLQRQVQDFLILQVRQPRAMLEPVVVAEAEVAAPEVALVFVLIVQEILEVQVATEVMVA